MTRDDKTLPLKVKDDIYLNDVVQTAAKSALGITFSDGTTFNLKASSQITIDTFVYEDGGKQNAGVFDVAKGTVAFVAAAVAKTGDMKITTPTATLGIRGTSGLVEVPEGASATSKNNVNVKLYADADGRVGRIEVNDRAGARLGFLTAVSSGFAIRPGSGGVRFAAVPITITPQMIARDTGFVRQVHSMQTFGRRMFDEQRAFRRANPTFVNPNRPMRQPGQFRQNNLPGQPGAPPERLAGTTARAAAAGIAKSSGTATGIAAAGRAGTAGLAAAAGFAAAGWTIAAAGPARSGQSAGPDRTATAAGSARPAGAASAAEPAGTARDATGRIAVATDRGSATTRPARTAATAGSAATDRCANSARTTRLAATARAAARNRLAAAARTAGLAGWSGRTRDSRGCRNRRVSFPAGCPLSPIPVSRFPVSGRQVSRFRDNRHCRRRAPDNSAKAAFPARPACNSPHSPGRPAVQAPRRPAPSASPPPRDKKQRDVR